jgi:hypothetical protein
MVPIRDIVEFISGTPQSRIVETAGDDVPIYCFYAQQEIEEDLAGLESKVASKQIRTFDTVTTVATGDVVFSLVSGKAAIVQAGHSGYLFTQNYVVLVPSSRLDARYLVYALNENREIERQLQSGKQGSATLKYTIRQLNALTFPLLPSREKQGVIGELYFSQIRLDALRKQASELETTLVMEKIRKADQS